MSNELFSANYMDRQIRKDCANHVRETVRFSRNVNACMERLWVYFFYHNYRKPYRIGKGEKRTHAECAGIAGEAIGRAVRRYYTRREFLSRSRLAGPMRRVWLRSLKTPLKHGSEYLPQFALA